MFGRLRTARSIYKARGVLALRDSALEKLPFVRQEYQQRISHVFESRQEIINALIPSSATSVLDIGSNLGGVASGIAKTTSCHVLAWEPDSKIHARAVRRERNPSVVLCTGEPGPVTVKRLPRFNVILLLNVYHNWVKQYGISAAHEMLKGLADKAELLIVHGSSRKSFGSSPPSEFTPDSNEETFWFEFLSSTFPRGEVTKIASIDAGQHMTQPVIHIHAVRLKRA